MFSDAPSIDHVNVSEMIDERDGFKLNEWESNSRILLCVKASYYHIGQFTYSKNNRNILCL